MPTNEIHDEKCKKVDELRNYHRALSILENYPTNPELKLDRVRLIHSIYHGPKIKGRDIASMSDRQIYCISNSILKCAEKTTREGGIGSLNSGNIEEVLKFESRLRESKNDGTLPPLRTSSLLQTGRNVPYNSPFREILMNLLRDRRKSYRENPTPEQGSLF